MIALGITACAVLLAGVWTLFTYNRLVRLRNLLTEAWSGIDVQLRKRHTLVPALVECVKGIRDHERTTLERVTAARAAAQAAQGVAPAAAAETGLSQNIRGLFALVEAYPNLKAGDNFRQLSANLVAIEDDLQYARRYYNGVTRDYNIRVQSFPDLLVARPFGFAPAAFFEVESSTERLAPEVRT